MGASIISLLKSYWLEILGLMIGAYFSYNSKKKRWEDFCRQQNLETEIKKTKNQDGKIINYTEYKYPSFSKRKGYILLKNLNYKVDLEQVKKNIPNYEKYFATHFLDASYDKKKNIIFKKDLFPKKVEPYTNIKNSKILLGVSQNAKNIEPNYQEGIRLGLFGPSDTGKSSLIANLFSQIPEEIEFYTVGPRRSFSFGNQKYYDKDSKEDLEKLILDIQKIKQEIKEIKTHLRSQDRRDEEFSKFVIEKGYDYKYKVFIFDDASTYLKMSLYSKTDEMRNVIQILINEINIMLREYRIYKISTVVVAHSTLVDEVDISQANYNYVLFNKATNEIQSQVAVGDKKLLMNEILGKGCWYLKSEKNNCYIKTVYKE